MNARGLHFLLGQQQARIGALRITPNYPRICAMRIVTAVTRPRMSASPG